MDGVVLITGIMAAGKSSVAQALAERLPRAAHVRGDVFRRMIVSGREEYEPGAGGEAEAQLRLRYGLSAATVDAYAQAGCANRGGATGVARPRWREPGDSGRWVRRCSRA